MTKYTITEIDVTTGEEITRPMTTQETSQINAEVAQNQAIADAEAAKADAKAALLTRLGITAEEAALLLK